MATATAAANDGVHEREGTRVTSSEVERRGQGRAAWSVEHSDVSGTSDGARGLSAGAQRWRGGRR